LLTRDSFPIYAAAFLRSSSALACIAPYFALSGCAAIRHRQHRGIGPPIAGVVMQYVGLAAPVFIGGGMRIVYDIVLYLSFRHVRPPEDKDAPQIARL